MYWVSIDNPAVKVALLNGTGQVTLLNESKANYSGITLYQDALYISDKDTRSVEVYCLQATDSVMAFEEYFFTAGEYVRN